MATNREKVRNIINKMHDAVRKNKKVYRVVHWLSHKIYKPVMWNYQKVRHAPRAINIYFNGDLCTRYAGGARTVYEQMVNDPAFAGYTFFWGVDGDLKAARAELRGRSGTKVRARNTWGEYKVLARSKYWFTSSGLPKYVKPRKEQKWIYLRDEKPLLPMEPYGAEAVFEAKAGALIHNKAKHATRVVSPAPAFSTAFASAWGWDSKKAEEKIWEIGLSDSGRLLEYTEEGVLRAKMNLGVPLDKKVVLYATDTCASQSEPVDLHGLQKQLGEDYVVLYRDRSGRGRGYADWDDKVIDVSIVDNITDIMLASDALATDYSGLMFDYANLKRPIVLYRRGDMPTGAYFDMAEFPFPVYADEKGMADGIKKAADGFVCDADYEAFVAKYNMPDAQDGAAKLVEAWIDIPPVNRAFDRRADFKAFVHNTLTKCLGFFRSMGVKFNENDRKIQSYKDIHKGERCFLIGNGPSLTIADLDKLKGEKSFACNLIYGTFPMTEWRPTYYFALDMAYAKTEEKNIHKLVKMPMFSFNNIRKGFQVQPKNIIYGYVLSRISEYHVGKPPAYHYPAIATVMAYMIEMALYMGFSEIYLLGVDCGNIYAEGQQNYFMEGYQTEEVRKIDATRRSTNMHRYMETLEDVGQDRMDRSILAYAKLRKHAEARGRKIYNATRGGKLEIYERKDLDEVLGTEKETETV